MASRPQPPVPASHLRSEAASWSAYQAKQAGIRTDAGALDKHLRDGRVAALELAAERRRLRAERLAESLK